jgi:CRP-like cAMP-binding protein
MSRGTFENRFRAICASLDGAEVDALTARLERRELAEGEALIVEGQPSSGAWLIWQGNLVVTLGSGREALEVGQVGPGAIVGETSLLDSGVASATVRADAPSAALRLSSASLDELRDSHPRVAANLVRAMCVTLAYRVRFATERLDVMHGGGRAAPPPKSGLLEALRALFDRAAS